ncbi:MAG: hypothetical protein V2G41_09515 [bacterium JZ-2024 1]
MYLEVKRGGCTVVDKPGDNLSATFVVIPGSKHGFVFVVSCLAGIAGARFLIDTRGKGDELLPFVHLVVIDVIDVDLVLSLANRIGLEYARVDDGYVFAVTWGGGEIPDVVRFGPYPGAVFWQQPLNYGRISMLEYLEWVRDEIDVMECRSKEILEVLETLKGREPERGGGV